MSASGVLRFRVSISYDPPFKNYNIPKIHTTPLRYPPSLTIHPGWSIHPHLSFLLFEFLLIYITHEPYKSTYQPPMPPAASYHHWCKFCPRNPPHLPLSLHQPPHIYTRSYAALHPTPCGAPTRPAILVNLALSIGQNFLPFFSSPLERALVTSYLHYMSLGCSLDYYSSSRIGLLFRSLLFNED